jgi:Holliday junction resolvase RusA-like endonuclease
MITNCFLEFEVIGTPMGKGRPKFVRRGAFVSAYTPKKTVDYESKIKAAARAAMAGAKPFEGAVVLYIYVISVPPVSWPKEKRQKALDQRIRPTVKPDIDNVAKAVLDAGNGILWLDDKQVVSLTAHKRYGEDASVVVQAYEYESIKPAVME